MVVNTQLEKRLLWHPRVPNKFAVGGSGQITLYELHPGHSETKIKHVTSQQELQLMKVLGAFLQKTMPLITCFSAFNGLRTRRLMI